MIGLIDNLIRPFTFFPYEGEEKIEEIYRGKALNSEFSQGALLRGWISYIKGGGKYKV